METQYFKQYSPALGRDMECKVYGHAGRPVLYIPCQDGRFFDFENFKMADVWSPWIEAGDVMVFSIDTIDQETWSNKSGNPRWRICRHEQWMRYITDEMVPFMRQMVNERNGWTGSYSDAVLVLPMQPIFISAVRICSTDFWRSVVFTQQNMDSIPTWMIWYMPIHRFTIYPTCLLTIRILNFLI